MTKENKKKSPCDACRWNLDDELYRKTGLRVEDIKQRKGRGRR